MKTKALNDSNRPKLFGLVPVILLVAGLIAVMIVLKLILSKYM
jgi:hypothetical protein